MKRLYFYQFMIQGSNGTIDRSRMTTGRFSSTKEAIVILRHLVNGLNSDLPIIKKSRKKIKTQDWNYEE